VDKCLNKPVVYLIKHLVIFFSSELSKINIFLSHYFDFLRSNSQYAYILPASINTKTYKCGKKMGLYNKQAIMWFAKAYKFAYSHLITFHQVGQIAVMPI